MPMTDIAAEKLLTAYRILSKPDSEGGVRWHIFYIGDVSFRAHISCDAYGVYGFDAEAVVDFGSENARILSKRQSHHVGSLAVTRVRLMSVLTALVDEFDTTPPNPAIAR